MRLRTMMIGVALLGLSAGAAQAQYYPQQGYAPPPGGGYAPPPPGYQPGYPPQQMPPPPGYGQSAGFRCRARVDTPQGPQRLICIKHRPRPLGSPCDCPPPQPPPGYGYGPPLHGHIIP